MRQRVIAFAAICSLIGLTETGETAEPRTAAPVAREPMADMPSRSEPAMRGSISAPPLEREPMRDIADFGTNWYIRGSVGYLSGSASGLKRASMAFTQFDMESSYSAGVGAGWKKDALRIDITADWLAPADLSARGPVAANGIQNITAKAGAVALLANAYVDLGTWSGITPYIGAGIGTSYVTLADYRPALLPGVATLEDNSRWNFTWALMAGVGIAINPSVSLDLGYRYLNLGDGKTGPDSQKAHIALHDWSAHEFRLGARFMID